MKITTSYQEHLAKKFVDKWHLNVQEIELIGKQGISGKNIVDSIVRILEKHGKFPINFNIETGFEGALVEVKENYNYTITYMSESSYMKFSIVKTQFISNIREAAKSVGYCLWKDCYDGIKINWDAEK